MKVIIFLLVFVSSVVFACPSGGGDSITVMGVVSSETFPGSPNYEAVGQGDGPETYWILKIETPMCFSPDADFMDSEVTLNRLQLLLYKAKEEVHLEEGGKYEFTGTTVPSHAGHHKTRVMLEVEYYKRL